MNKSVHKLYVTGDCHGGKNRIMNMQFAYNTDLEKDDILFCCGDWGYIFKGTCEEDKFLDEIIETRAYTICFVDGNHENFDILLNRYPVEIWNGGKARIIRRDKNNNPQIIYLARGQVYEIYGKTVYTFGGGYSFDRHLRKKGISWWEQEMPSDEEMSEGIRNLEKHNFSVNYIITHTAPEETMCILYPMHEEEKKLNNYLEYIREITKYDRWFFGHVHKDQECWRNQYALYFEVMDMCSGNVVSGKK